jgi:hypothetical protein
MGALSSFCCCIRGSKLIFGGKHLEVQCKEKVQFLHDGADCILSSISIYRPSVIPRALIRALSTQQGLKNLSL